MANMNPAIPFPDFDDLNPDLIDFTLDVDLDELMILFYGRDRIHSVHPMNPVLSTLVDPKSGELVGVSLSRFAKQVLVETPHALALAMNATVLAGEDVFAPGEFMANGVRRKLSGSVSRGILAAYDSWQESAPPKTDKRSAYEALLQYA